ncbi:MAG: putative F0F1-ATPase subunit Ca2+/Mg2+ transporter [Frankiales bacterium]|jgi:ATP synthase protein I|nr:putative F0F1-ATPase subunit Ca2+/Mg2+ transporter [Frankiales bacterium]
MRRPLSWSVPDTRNRLPEQIGDPPDSGGPSLTLGGLIGIGFANAVCVAAGLVLGHLLDGWLGTAPVMVLLGIGLGLALGAVGSVMEIRRYLQD